MVRSLRPQTDAGPVTQPEPTLLGLLPGNLQPLPPPDPLDRCPAGDLQRKSAERGASRSRPSRHPAAWPRSGDSRSARIETQAPRCPRSGRPRRLVLAESFAASSDAVRERGKRGAPRCGTSAERDRRKHGGGRGSEVLLTQTFASRGSPRRISFSIVRSETAFRSRSLAIGLEPMAPQWLDPSRVPSAASPGRSSVHRTPCAITSKSQVSRLCEEIGERVRRRSSTTSRLGYTSSCHPSRGSRRWPWRSATPSPA